jgi:hypothetical protein
VIGLTLMLGPAALASDPLFTWSGDGATGSGWSAAKNWEAEVAPSVSGTVALSFPRIPSCVGVCYESKNDVSGLSAESIAIDDGDDYKLSGDALTLGAGGLTAAPAAGTSGPAGDVFELPIKLGATQTWSIAQRSGGSTGENGVALAGDVTESAYGLKIDLSNGPAVYLENAMEVGPLAIENASTSETHGSVDLRGAELNASDGMPVDLNHIFVLGVGGLGELKTDHVGVGIGLPGNFIGGIEATNAELDAGSEIEFLITGSGSAAWTDYSQLFSEGTIALGGARLYVYVYPPVKNGSCPVPAVGRSYTLVETRTLTGAFGNALEGSEIPVGYAKACGAEPARYLHIAYHESGIVQTVTATVVEAHTEGGSSGPLPPAPRPVMPISVAALEEKAPATGGGVSFPAGGALTVERGHTARVKLDCTGSKVCTGKLILTTRTTFRIKGGKKRSHRVTIGAVRFSIPAGKVTTVKIALNATGRGLLSRDHGRLAAHVAILGAAG